MREHSRELLDQVGKNLEHQVVGRGADHLASLVVAETLAKGIVDRLERLHDRERDLEEGAALERQRDRASLPLEQLRLRLTLEGLDLERNRRLAERHPVGGSAETPGDGNVVEAAQLLRAVLLVEAGG